MVCQVDGDAGHDMMSSDKTNSAGHENTSATIPGEDKERIGACGGSNYVKQEKR